MYSNLLKQSGLLSGQLYFTSIKIYFQFPRLVPSQLNFKPRVDGVLIPDQPPELLRKGEFVRMPVMTGNVKDEWARSSGWFTRDMDGPNIGKYIVWLLCTKKW